MASGTINGSTGNEYIDSKIEWSSVTSLANNTSTVTAKLYYRRNNTGYITTGTGSFSIEIGGTKVSKTATMNIGTDWVLAMTAEVTVKHNDDGSKYVTIRAAGSISGTTLSSTTCVASVTLDTIPRASAITSIGGSTSLGYACTIKWTPKASTIRFKLEFSLGSWKDTTDYISPKTTSAYIHSYQLPYEVAERAPLTGLTGTMKVTLYSYYTTSTTAIGSDSTTFTVTVPNNSSTQPSVSMGLSPVSNGLVVPFSLVYLQGKTKVGATFSGEGKYGADIDYYTLTVEGRNDNTDPYLSGYLSRSGKITVTGRATDSRGLYREVTEDINVIAYSKPTLVPADGENNIVCARCDQNGNLTTSGTYLKIKAGRSYSKVIEDGIQHNYCTIRYRYRSEASETFSEWETLLAEDASSDTIDLAPIPNVVTYASSSYVVQLGVIDRVGESDALQFVISTDFVTINVPKAHKGRRIGLFRYAEGTPEDGLYVGLPIFGGSIDSLKLGTRLTATASARLSLDDIMVAGSYYSPDKETTQYIDGAPANVDFGFGLEVREMQSKSNIRQTLYYGITTWYRHNDGQAWSSWVSALTGVSDEVIAQDFVVDSGISGLWRYRLWKSGDAELWGVITLNTVGDARHIYSDVGLPFPFTEYPTVTMTSSRAAAYSYRQWAVVLSEVYTLGESKIRLSMIHDSGGFVAGNTAQISVNIKGRWK